MLEIHTKKITMRSIIFGVADVTGKCADYFGFFKHEEDSKKELVIQMEREMKEKGVDLILKNDRVIKMVDDRTEEIVFIIHPIVLR